MKQMGGLSVLTPDPQGGGCLRGVVSLSGSRFGCVSVGNDSVFPRVILVPMTFPDLFRRKDPRQGDVELKLEIAVFHTEYDAGCSVQPGKSVVGKVFAAGSVKMETFVVGMEEHNPGGTLMSVTKILYPGVVMGEERSPDEG